MRIQKHQSRFIEMFGNAENTKPLSECIGTTFPGEWGEDDSDGTGVNVIRTTNFTNSGKLDLTNVVTRKIGQAKIDKKHLIPGDIILERSGGTADNPVGRVVYFEATGTFLFNNFTQLLRCKNGVNSLFVFYSLFNYYHTHKSEIRSMGNKTTGIQNLKMNKYWDIPIADAHSEQQEQFVCLYKQADKSKFTDFKSRFIEMFSSEPKMSLSEVSKITMGSSPDSKYYNLEKQGLPFYQGKTEFGDMYIGEASVYCKEPVRIAEPGDILMSVRAPVGTVNFNVIECCIGRGLASIRPKRIIEPLYLFYALRLKEADIDALGTGSTFKAINKDTLFSFKIEVGDKAQQNEFVHFAEQADKSKYLS